MLKAKQFLRCFLLCSGMAASTAVAHEGATGLLKARMDAMSAIGDRMKAISQMLNGKTAFDANTVSKLAGEISTHASEIPNHFKEPLHDPISEASPAIWNDMDRFLQIADELTTHANDLSAATLSAETPSGLLEAFGKVAATCKTCHKDFRVKK